ncbi:MAG: N-acetylmuramoyl-L-alanine amidase [Crocinitomicaceae bacterium]
MLKQFTLFCFLFIGFLTFGVKTEITILIDPGHGGKDPGHLSVSETHLPEKDLNLLIAKKIGHYLQHNLSNVAVLYTRTKDIYPTLDDRVIMANNKSVDYMMSIHCNGSENVDILGTETHIHNFESKEAYKWAFQVEKQFKTRAGRKSRGVKTGADIGHSLQILKFTKMPTILIECGFLTQVGEAAYLNSGYGQEIISSAIFRATRAFLKSAHPNIDFSPVDVTGPSFKVQIMSSIDPLKTNIPEFEKLDYKVERVKINSSSMYKYKYFVGPFATRKLAKKAQKIVQEKGYKDAFIVNFE